MTLPRFILGHNALIGVNHRDRSQESYKLELTDKDRDLLRTAGEIGVGGMVLDNHPVAVQAAEFLAEHAPGVKIYPMIPYAQGVVDAASRSGLPSVVQDMVRTGVSLGPMRMAGTLGRLMTGDLQGAGARVAIAHFVKEFPDREPKVVFLHNAVTDLLMAWGCHDALAGFAAACRSRNSVPGFVTLNPGRIADLAAIVGRDSWFMGAVNPLGMQMSPSREATEKVLQDPSLNVLAMTVLAGGMLKPEEAIPHAFSFPAVKSVIIGTSRPDNLRRIHALATRPEAPRAPEAAPARR